VKKKMAAELYPASLNTNLPNSNGAVVTAASKKNIVQVTQAVTVPTTTATQQNINNNNVETTSWQSTHPTLRERYVKLQFSFYFIMQILYYAIPCVVIAPP
jgi:BTB/POZ domain-containing protein 3/6